MKGRDRGALMEVVALMEKEAAAIIEKGWAGLQRDLPNDPRALSICRACYLWGVAASNAALLKTGPQKRDALRHALVKIAQKLAQDNARPALPATILEGKSTCENDGTRSK